MNHTRVERGSKIRYEGLIHVVAAIEQHLSWPEVTQFRTHCGIRQKIVGCYKKHRKNQRKPVTCLICAGNT